MIKRKIDIKTQIQLVLLDLEETILKERMPDGLYRKGDWEPNEYSERIMKIISEGHDKKRSN